MFSNLCHHFLSKKQQFNHDYQHATLEELNHDIVEMNALRRKETSAHDDYDEVKPPASHHHASFQRSLLQENASH